MNVSQSAPSAVRDVLVGAAVALLVGALTVALLATPGGAQVTGEVTAELNRPPGSTTLLGGENLVGEAIAFSREAFPGTAEEVLLGRVDEFPDLLASGAVQGLLDGPLLLTETASLNDDTAAELERLSPTRVTILGGTAAVSAAVENTLRDDGFVVRRLSGETRLETAVELARSEFPDASRALLVRAYPGQGAGDPTQAFADSLAAGALAADTGLPVLLTESHVLSGSTRSYLEASSISSVLIVGGTEAVTTGVETTLATDLGLAVQRRSGPNRFATATAVAEERGVTDASQAGTVILVEGQGADAYASGFTSAALSGQTDAPVVLANGDQLPTETQQFLDPADGEAALVCAPNTSQAACDAAAAAMGNAAVDCTELTDPLPVVPTDLQTLPTELPTEGTQRPSPGAPCRSGEGLGPLPLPTFTTMIPS